MQPPSRAFGGAIDESAARFRDDILGTGPEGDLSRAAEGFVLKMLMDVHGFIMIHQLIFYFL